MSLGTFGASLQGNLLKDKSTIRLNQLKEKLEWVRILNAVLSFKKF